MTRYNFNAPLGRLLRVAAFVVALQPAWLPAAGQGRIARMTRDNFLYSNWVAPHTPLDSCLDKNVTEVHIPEAIEHNGRSYRGLSAARQYDGFSLRCRVALHPCLQSAAPIGASLRRNAICVVI